MIHEFQLRVLPEVAGSEQALKEYVSNEYGIDAGQINAVRILKRSIDARQRVVYVNLKIRVYRNEQPEGQEYTPVAYRDVSGGKQAVIVGAGPGGLFAALRLIELGIRPIVIERGKNVRDRKKDIANISREQRVDPESNYSFGEGGAALHPQQETRQCGQDTQCVLPAWSQHVHIVRCASAHRYRQVAGRDRKHARHHIVAWRRGAF